MSYNVDLHNRRIYLSEEIDEKTTNTVLKAFHHIDAKDGDIELWINCGGGTVTGMYTIYDAIKACNNKVICIGTGRVTSAATLLLVAGDESYATKYTTFMAHEGEMNFEEKQSVSPTTLRSELGFDKRLEKRYCRLMADHTKPTEKWWKRYAIESKKEVWLDLDDMIDKEIVEREWPIT